MKQVSSGLQRSGFVRDRQIREYAVPVSHGTLWSKKWRERTKFPEPIKLSPGVTVWEAAKVWAWVEAQQVKTA